MTPSIRHLLSLLTLAISLAVASTAIGRPYWGVYVESEIVGRVVDESGALVAGAIVDTWTFMGKCVQSTSDADGLVTIRLLHRGATVIARDADGSLCGHLSIADAADATEVEITLRPARRLTITTQFLGEPIANATVEVHWNQLPIANGLTDAEGICRLTIPEGWIIQHLITFKSGVGFAGFTRGRTYHEMEHDEGGDVFIFELSRATQHEVQVVDKDGNPVPRVTVFPDRISLPTMESPIQLFQTRVFDVETDDEGVARFDVFPEVANDIRFEVETNERFYCPRVQPRVETPNDVVTIEVIARVPITGVVRFPDGSPAPGVPITVDAQGPREDWFHDEAFSNERGEFELNVPYDYACLVAVFKNPYPARPLEFVVPHEGGLDDLILQLTQPTYFRGTVRNVDGSELDDSYLHMNQLGKPQRIVVDGEQWDLSPISQFFAEVDANGEFEFILGPGRYSAYYSGHTPESCFDFEITNQSEVVHHFRLPPKEN